MEKTYNNYDNVDNIVWSAFTLTQFPNIKWNMIATDTFDDKCRIDQMVTGITNNGKKETYNVELKTREFNAYSDKCIKDCFLECDKYEAFKKFGNNKNIYVAIYPYVKSGGLIYIWDVDTFSEEELEKIKNKRLMKKRTCDNTTEKVFKDVYELPTDKAQKYRFDSKQYYQ